MANNTAKEVNYKKSLSPKFFGQIQFSDIAHNELKGRNDTQLIDENKGYLFLGYHHKLFIYAKKTGDIRSIKAFSDERIPEKVREFAEKYMRGY